MKKLIVKDIIDDIDPYGGITNFTLFVDSVEIETIQVFNTTLEPGVRFKIIRELLNAYKSRN